MGLSTCILPHNYPRSYNAVTVSPQLPPLRSISTEPITVIFQLPFHRPAILVVTE